MLGLAVDSADRLATAALWRMEAATRSSDDADGVSILDQDRLSPEEGKADQLISVIERLLDRQQLGYPDLDVIAVNRGPGSFTGVRSAVALVRGLALAADRPVLGMTSHEAQAAIVQPDETERPLVVALDARRGEVYAGRFSQDGEPLSEIEAISPAALAAELKSGAWRLAGHGADLIMRALDAGAEVEMIETDAIDARAVALAAAKQLSAGEKLVQGFALRPLYVRAPDAVPPTPLIATPKDLEVSA